LVFRDTNYKRSPHSKVPLIFDRVASVAALQELAWNLRRIVACPGGSLQHSSTVRMRPADLEPANRTSDPLEAVDRFQSASKMQYDKDV
jgi:hypothetical protein